MPGAGQLTTVQPSGRLQVRDLVLLGEILRRHNEGISAYDGRVFISLSQAALAMGYRGPVGGEQRRLARASLKRLVDSTLVWRELGKDEVIRELRWHLLDAMSTYYSASDGSGSARVSLSRVTQELVEDGYLHYLKADVCRRLVQIDEVAARLWMMLECERLRRPFHYQVFRAPVGGTPTPSKALFISEVTGLDAWRSRRSVARRLREAVRVIAEVDPRRYEMSLRRGREVGMYVLDVQSFHRPWPEAAAREAGSGTPVPRSGPERPQVAAGTQGGRERNAPRAGEERP